MENIEKYTKKLCSHPLFAGCNVEALSRILREYDASVKTVNTDEEILSPATTSRSVGMLLSGKAAVTTPDPSKVVLLRYLNEGDLFGIANLFTMQPYVSVIRAVGTCKLLCIPELAIRALLETDHTFMYAYLSFLSGRICFLNKKIGYLTAGSAERRLALYLLSLGQSPVTLPLSISALAEVLDVGRASLYRAFEHLTEDGFLKKEGRVFHLSDTEKMLNKYQ